MALKLGGKELERLKKQAESALKMRDKAKGTVERVVGSVVQTAEVQAGAFVGGVIQGKTYDTKTKRSATIAGIPVEAAAGTALHIMGVFGLAGDHSRHLHNVGDGLVASFVTKLGAGIGSEWRERGSITGKKDTAAGELPAHEVLSDRDVRNLTEPIRTAQPVG